MIRAGCLIIYSFKGLPTLVTDILYQASRNYIHNNTGIDSKIPVAEGALSSEFMED